MKKICLLLIIFTTLMLISCLLPHSKPGEETPFSQTIEINVSKGTINITPEDTDTGKRTMKASEKQLKYSKKRDSTNLTEAGEYSYHLLGNHTVIFYITTMDEEAEFSVTAFGNSVNYTVKNSDILGKTVYISNTLP